MSKVQTMSRRDALAHTNLQDFQKSPFQHERLE